jgi:hypothetical protein
MIFLIDHNLKCHALVLFGAIATQGWLDIVPMQFVTFAEMDLLIDSDDRTVWRLAQENQMILLTANRSMKGKDSLEQVMREENTSESLPVITVSNADRLEVGALKVLLKSCLILIPIEVRGESSFRSILKTLVDRVCSDRQHGITTLLQRTDKVAGVAAKVVSSR